MDLEKWLQLNPGDTILSDSGRIPFIVTEIVDGHVWGNFEESFIPGECCRICGVMRRRDHQNKPCKGPQKISLRQKDWAVKVRLRQCFKEYYGPTLLSALRAAKDGA